MDLATRTERLKKYLAQVRGDGATTLEGVDTHLESTLGAEAPASVAGPVIEAARRLEETPGPADPADLRMLEAIVLPLDRPVALIQNDTWGRISPRYRALEQDDARRGLLAPAIRGIGRVEVPGIPTLPYAGTAFLVGTGLLLTNRHVAELFCAGLREALTFQDAALARIDFRRERGVAVQEGTTFRIKGVVWIHPHWDAALLAIEGELAERPPLQLQPDHPDELVGRKIVVVGYPARDERNDLLVQDQVFQRIYGVKRFQPGEARGARVVESFGKAVRAIDHDASTLGGNSGSAVIDLETGGVLGLHFAGSYLDGNFAVPAWELAQDPRVVDRGVSFTSLVEGAPAWLAAWEDPRLAVEAARPRVITASPANRLVEDWWERLDDAQLRRIAQADPAGTWEAVIDAFGPVDGEAFMRDLIPADASGLDDDAGLETPSSPLFPGTPVIYLHGILGSHLHDTASGGQHVWLHALRALFWDLGPRLSLKPDGLTDLGRTRLDAVGHLALFYGEAQRAWTRAGLDVRPFSYDWRKPVEVAAQRLQRWLADTLAPHEKAVIVAHSMGGLVAAAFASGFRQMAEEKVREVVLVGSPVRGSFAPVECMLGVYPFLVKLAKVTASSVTGLRQMSSTLSGMIDMLPDPMVFPEAERLYRADTWDARFRPTQEALDRSLRLKTTLAGSPLFDPSNPLFQRTTLVLGSTFGTVDRFGADGRPGPRDGRGDGTVPLGGARVEGVATFHASGKAHDQLMRHRGVIAAVTDLVVNGEITSLAAFDPDHLPPVEESPMAEVMAAAVDGRAAEIRLRWERGEVKARDYFWLYGPGAVPGSAAPFD